MSCPELLKWFLKIFILMFVWFNESSCNNAYMKRLKTVRDKVLDGYDKAIPPSANKTNSTHIMLALFPTRLLDVDEENSLIKMEFYSFMNWDDERLKWNTSYLNTLDLPSELIWTPNIMFLDGHDVQLTDDGRGTTVQNGNVEWGLTIRAKTSCESLAKALANPYEAVRCSIRIGTVVHTDWPLHTPQWMSMAQFRDNNPRWQLLTNRTTHSYIQSPGSDWGVSTIGVFLRRRAVPEIEATRRMCLLVLILNLSVFWLPPDSSKKILTGGILLLVLTVMFTGLKLHTKYPLSSSFASEFYEVAYVQSATYAVVCTLLLQIFVIFNVCKISGSVRPPTVVMNLLGGRLGRLACLPTSVEVDQKVPIDVLQLHQESGPIGLLPPSGRGEWTLVAACLDRLFFILMVIVTVATNC